MGSDPYLLWFDHIFWPRSVDIVIRDILTIDRFYKVTREVEPVDEVVEVINIVDNDEPLVVEISGDSSDDSC